jgi:hypothetical protein
MVPNLIKINKIVFYNIYVDDIGLIEEESEEEEPE